MNFKKWYYSMQEVGTGTNAIAVFARPIFGAIAKRTWPPTIGSDEDKKDSKKDKSKNK